MEKVAELITSVSGNAEVSKPIMPRYIVPVPTIYGIQSAALPLPLAVPAPPLVSAQLEPVLRKAGPSADG